MISKSNQTQYTNACQAGQAKQSAGNYAAARQDFEKALTLAATGPERAKALLGIGEAYNAEAISKIASGYFKEQFAAAQAEFAKVLAIADSTLDQKAQAQYSIGIGCFYLKQYPAAQVEWEKVVAMAGVSAVWRVQAQMFIGRMFKDISRPADDKTAEALAAYAKVFDIPGLSPAQRAEAHMAIVSILLAKKNYAEARAELAKILKISDLPPASVVRAQVSLGKTCLLEANYVAARDALSKAMSTAGIPAYDKVEAQLYIGLSYYEAKDYEHAGPELRKVLAMPGASARQVHEATLRLRLRKLLPGNEKFLTVLFIGASQTQVFDVPQIVEVLAASAPAGSPRIIADGFLRGGTGIQHFWEEGEGPGTARAKIMTEPFDRVVFETHPLLFGHDIFIKYATKFADLSRAQKATPIFFEAPAFFRNSYPEGYQKIHDDTVELGKTLKVTVAPADYAWMKYLGPSPTPEQRMALYHPDAVHPSQKGAYLIACCIYSAITGLSPVGLTHSIPTFGPDGISREEAGTLQKIAWEAYRQTNPK